MKYLLNSLFVIYLLTASFNIRAQVFEKLKKKAENVIEMTIEKVEEINSSTNSVKVPENNEEIDVEVTKTIQTEIEPTSISKTKPDLIRIKAPNSSFDPIELKALNGKPIFNAKYIDDNYTDENVEFSKYTFKRWQLLIGLKYTQPYIQSMNKEVFLENANENFVEYNVQRFVQNLANYLTTRNVWPKYFCLDEKQTITRRRGFRDVFSGQNWGGINSSAFNKQKIYRQFLSDHLETLVKWSQTQFPNDEMEGYVVWNTSSNYDFEKRGYWIEIPILYQITIFQENYNGFGTLVSSYKPLTSFEESLLELSNQRKRFVFFPVSANKANEIFKGEGIGNFTLSAKVKVIYVNTTEQEDGSFKLIYPEFEWNMISPNIEVYAHNENYLTLKLGEFHCVDSEYK